MRRHRTFMIAATLLVGVSWHTASMPATAQPTVDLRGSAYGQCYSRIILAEVENAGPGPAGSFVIRDRNGSLVRKVEGLAGKTQIHFELEGGEHAFEWPARIDADGQVIESDESNNIMWLAVPGCIGQVLLPWVRLR